ncbi:hypothetical protein [Streptomyces venezuelae]|uniref:hypothetical protein n=1 Tax=Streptomyces venezuelae TaxID=54571 RepID=UPI0034323B09
MTAQVPAVTPATVFDAQCAPSLVGDLAASQRYTVEGAELIAGPAGLLLLVEVGDVPDRSGVWSAQEVRLYGPAPVPVAERLLGTPWDWCPDAVSSPIHVAVREKENILYLGTAQVSHGETSEGVLTNCTLLLAAPLSRSLLDRVRPIGPPDVAAEVTWLEQVNSDRAAALEEFLTNWYPPLDEAPASPPAHSASPMPAGLQGLYRLAKRRPAVLGVQNRILPEQHLYAHPRGEMTVFGEENQGCFVWALPRGRDGADADPTVWFCVDDEEPVAEQEPLSGFLLQFALFEAAMSAAYHALPRGLFTSQEVDQLTHALQEVPLRPFWPGAGIRFFVGPSLVMYASCEGDNEFAVWAGAKQRKALDLLPQQHVDWSRFDG